MRVIYRKICHARYLYIKRNVEKVWGARYTLGARYLSKNTVINQLDAQNLFYNKFISCLYMFQAPCSHRQEVKIVLYSIWYHHT
jgi:hypothetical protein